MGGWSRVALVAAMSGGLWGTAVASAAKPPHPGLMMADVRGTQGYLGVDVRDVDDQRASALKMKEARGAEVIGLDHDAPACKAGLRLHDVILTLNGEPVEGETQLRRMLRETPAGRTIKLGILRDGGQQEISVQLADRAKVAASAWPDGQIVVDGFPDVAFNTEFPPMVRNMVPNIEVRPFALLGGGGLDVEPLGKQLGEFFGAPNGTGLLVRRVEPNSDAATAGLKAGDVITKVNGQPTESLHVWMMALAQNQGKAIQLTLIRNHKEQTLSYTPGATKTHSELEMPGFDAQVQQQLAGIDTNRIADEVQRSMQTLDVLQKVDWTELQKNLDENLQRIQLMQPELDEQLVVLKRMQPEIERQMEQVRPEIERQMKEIRPQLDRQIRKQVDEQMRQLHEQLKALQGEEFD